MLRVIDDTGARPPSNFGATAEPANLISGFSFEEWDDIDRFHWMERRAQISIEPKAQEVFLELWVLSTYHDLTQTLIVRVADVETSFSLPYWWSRVSIPVAPGATLLDLEANKLLPAAHHPDDPRELAIQIRPPVIHADRDRHHHIDRQHQNAVRNITEMLAGEPRPSSTPRMLGIDMHGVCNVKPPCVYCDWDTAKDLEGDNVDTPFTRETIEEWGDFYDNAGTLVNCSIGEPFMMKNFDELLDIFGEGGKVMELVTNGQILTDRNIEKLLGRDIDLYVSLDAATPETYAKLRNDRLELILANLRRLIAAKGGTRGLPRVHLVFMPMPVNVHELDAFVELCADLQVDRLVLRPLNFTDLLDLDWERGGHHFQYQNELLPFEELIRISGRAAELGRTHGVKIVDQLDFGGAMEEMFADQYSVGRSTAKEIATQNQPEATPARDPTPPIAATEPLLPILDEPQPETAGPMGADLPTLGAEKVPLCTEPWKSLYILRRGVLPCCYGSTPIAPMSDYREAWNSPVLQEIRQDLAAGRFHRYCLDSPSCPIIRKSSHAHKLPLRQALFMQARDSWHRFDKLLFGAPRRIVRPIKRLFQEARS
jgi:MoaA/NifB/PqqE/SkfB family radical SAM enzyme